MDVNIKDGDVIEVVPRARDPPSDPESDMENPESHEDEVKRVLHNTSQFIENVLGAYNEMLKKSKDS